MESKRILLPIPGLGQCLEYSGRIPSASHEKSGHWVQGYITSFSHTRGRAPLNVHAAPKFLGHLGQQFQKFQKSFKFETPPQIAD